jgi:hypothetical protein
MIELAGTLLEKGYAYEKFRSLYFNMQDSGSMADSAVLTLTR